MKVTYITHPDVVMDPDTPVPRWPLSPRGLERMRSMLSHPWVNDVSAVWSSDEQKALDGAAVLCDHLGIIARVHEGLRENDRSSTGFMEPDAFMAMRDRFFNEPETSAEGWERATDAQGRIVAAVIDIVSEASSESHIAIVAHGGVGALLLGSVLSEPIALRHDQTSRPGVVGGNYFAFDPISWTVAHSWQPIDGPD